jgi:peptidoglycan/xylan/chitin deacetylase (PgdA/CDA1 family)
VLAESSKLTAAAIPASRRGLSPAFSDWEPPEDLADPPPHLWSRRLIARALFAVGGVRVAEAVGRCVDLCRLPGGGASRIQPRFAILCYHRVGRGGVPIYSGLPPAVFEAQMNYLRRHYRIVSLAEALHEMSEPDGAPAVAITFDDGYADLHAHAFPILKQYKIPATIFLTVGAIESGEVPWYDRVFVAFQVGLAKELELPLNSLRSIRLGTPEQRLHAAVEFISLMRKLPVAEQRACCAKLESAVTLPEKTLAKRMLTWDQIRQMQSAGIFFGAHTMTHPVVNQLKDEALRWELGESKRILEERLQHQVQDFAFPFGKSDECGDAAVACLARLGYRCAVTAVGGLNRPATNPYALRRVSYCEERSLAMFALRLARLFLLNEGNQAG